MALGVYLKTCHRQVADMIRRLPGQSSGNLPLTFLHSYELVRARASEKVDKSTSNLESKKS